MSAIMKMPIILGVLSVLLCSCFHTVTAPGSHPINDEECSLEIDRAIPVIWFAGIDFNDVSLEEAVAAINAKIRTEAMVTNVMVKFGPNTEGKRSRRVTIGFGRVLLKSVVKCIATLNGFGVRVEKEKNGDTTILLVECYNGHAHEP
jgi:hypothetical protein